MTFPPIDPLVCRYATTCSGCVWIDVPYSEQAQRKIKAVEDAWKQINPDSPLPAIQYRAIAPGGLRDRADFVIDSRSGEARLGLFDRDHQEIIDIEICAQFSAPLQKWLEEFRTLRFPIARGSIRLRVSPQGLKGAWLDFANVDVKMLLEEQTVLRKLLAMDAVVEIGQRRKQLIEREGVLKLGEPIGQPWFETYVDGEPQPLYTSVGNFTQPGFAANNVLVETVIEAISTLTPKPKRVVEFGSGVGNFTLPLANFADHVDAFEIDALASAHLQTALRASGLSGKVVLHIGDFQNLSEKRAAKLSTIFKQIDLAMVDPPRSGLKKFLDPLLETGFPPKAFLYVSCFVESFTTDAAQLLKRGYICERLTVVDQFPQTPHAELVALLTRV